jgi:hypothetical protein
MKKYKQNINTEVWFECRKSKMLVFISYLVFWQERENEISCMSDRRVREMDMNAFCCLNESEK